MRRARRLLYWPHAPPGRSRTPRVSVGMPVYNGERFVGQALDSLVAQSFTDLEIVISDNASDDGTAAICAEYVRRDARVRYVRSAHNVGLAKNFERVVALSAGHYFKLANADDLCSPDLVARCVEVLDRDPEVVLCYGKTTLIDGEGQTLRPYEDRLGLRSASVAERFRQVLDRVGLVNGSCSGSPTGWRAIWSCGRTERIRPAASTSWTGRRPRPPSARSCCARWPGGASPS